MTCRCGHRRHTHYRISGRVKLPCQAMTVQQVRPIPGRPGGVRLVYERCKCRDWHPAQELAQ